MGSIKQIVLLMSVLVSLFSCSMLDKGYTNEYQQYVPKKPKYKLKDKLDNHPPASLNLHHVYRLTHMTYRGEQQYPPLSNTNTSMQELGLLHIKFYPDGRCLGFAIGSLSTPIQESDLNPNNPHYSKQYYYATDGKTVQVEDFIYGNGYGEYHISRFTISPDGKTLTFDDGEGTITTYSLIEIATDWKNYPVDW